MQIETITRQLERPELHHEMMRRATRDALARFSGRLRRVVVTLGDVNGPRGGPDKRCTVRIEGRIGRRAVVVSATDVTARTALARALERATRTTARRIERNGWQASSRRGGPTDRRALTEVR